MAKSLVGALALASLPSALAFRNTSPYFLFSTAELNLPADDATVAQANKVVGHVTDALKGCPTNKYFLLHQKGVSSADLSDARRTTPRLARHLNGESEYVKSAMVVPEVIHDESTASAVSAYLQKNCGAQVLSTDEIRPGGKDQQIVQISFPALSVDQDLRRQLEAMDSELDQLISKHADFEDFTVIFTSTPPTKFASETPPYEMEDPYHDMVQQMELKRDLSAHKRAELNQAGLFERYQYFTPGLFMGLAAIVPLFLIVIVGVKALLSLEVSYFAFSKEMGPAAQRKQQ